ncbi:MAG: ABC transporter substrate-binding protein [Undibacterium sp.]|nr:ABC transporter substrate-binding protein [Undibacterium sp.]
MCMSLCAYFCTPAAYALALPSVAANPGNPATPSNSSASLQVLHWWTSISERRAANVLVARLANEGVEWKDVAIPGGAGIGAGKVLKGRVLSSDAPEVTQIIGVAIGDWAQLGLLLEFDNVASSGNWNTVLFPTVASLIKYRHHVVAAPLGIHRNNTLFFNRKLFAKLGLALPLTWAEFERSAQILKAAGVQPLAQSSEAWQVTSLFENLILGESGPEYYRDLFVRQNPLAAQDKRMAEALERLRKMKSWMGANIEERAWPEVVQSFIHQDAAMLIMGDWAKAEMQALGWSNDEDFVCTPMPGTVKYHLYSVDSLSMFAKDFSHSLAQEKLAKMLVTPALQMEYNNLKGAVPVRRDADVAKMDSCARASWTAFAQGAELQAPSLVHRMANDEQSRDAIIAEIHRFFLNDSIKTEDVQRRLAALFRTFNLHRMDKKM